MQILYLDKTNKATFVDFITNMLQPDQFMMKKCLNQDLVNSLSQQSPRVLTKEYQNKDSVSLMSKPSSITDTSQPKYKDKKQGYSVCMSQPKLKSNGMIIDELVDVKNVKPKNKKVIARMVKNMSSSGSRDRKSELDRMFEKIKKKKKIIRKLKKRKVVGIFCQEFIGGSYGIYQNRFSFSHKLLEWEDDILGQGERLNHNYFTKKNY